MKDYSEFIRNSLVDSDIKKALDKGNSIKLIGIPQIGISTILKYIQKKFNHDNLINFNCFYINTYFSIKDIKKNMSKQLNELGVEKIVLQSDSLKELFKEISSIFSTQICLFLLDDFHKNLEGNKDNTLLNLQTVTDIQHLVEDNTNKIQFIVTYNHPVDSILNTDWYLRMYGLNIEMLDDNEASNLVKIQCDNNSNENKDSKTISLISYYGGRHPSILKKASVTDFNNSYAKRNFRRWVYDRYIEIERYIKEKESPSNQNMSWDLLKSIAKTPIPEKNIFQPKYDLAKAYCFIDESDNTYHLFSKHFAEYMAPTSMYKNFLYTIIIVLLTFALVPIIYSFSLFFFQNSIKKVLVIPEFDFSGLNIFYYLKILFESYNIYYIFFVITTIHIALLIKLIFKEQKKIFFWSKFQEIGRYLQSNKWHDIFLFAPINILTAIVVIILCSITMFLNQQIDIIKKHQDSQVLSNLINSYDKLINIRESEKSNIALRDLWLKYAYISFDSFPKEYLIITPLVIEYENNFPFAVNKCSKYLEEAWYQYLGINPNIVHQDDKKIKERLLSIVNLKNNKDIFQYTLALWNKDQQNKKNTIIYKKLLDLVPNSENKNSNIFQLNNNSIDDSIKKIVSLIYVNIKIGIKNNNRNFVILMMQLMNIVRFQE